MRSRHWYGSSFALPSDMRAALMIAYNEINPFANTYTSHLTDWNFSLHIQFEVYLRLFSHSHSSRAIAPKMSTLCELFKHVEKFDNFICLENVLSTFTLTHIWLTQAGHKHRVSSTYSIKIRMNLMLAKNTIRDWSEISTKWNFNLKVMTVR